MLNGLGIGFVVCNHLNKNKTQKQMQLQEKEKNKQQEKEKEKEKEKGKEKKTEDDSQNKDEDTDKDKDKEKEKSRIYTPYIQNFQLFMDTPSTNIGFGIFFAKNRSYVDKNTNEPLKNLFNVSAFCESRFYQTYFISKYFDNDGGLIQINIGDEIGLLMDHETEMSYLFINDTNLGKVFFGAPPYFVPAIHCWLDKPIPYPKREMESQNENETQRFIQ